MASNVFGYKEPQCFVEKDKGREQTLQTVQAFVEHLERIAEKPSKLELQHLTPLLKRLEEALGPVSQHVWAGEWGEYRFGQW